MRKPTLRYRVHWTPALEGHAYNTIRRYWPALSPWYEWEDLQQESYLVFMRLQAKYGMKVDNPAWFMTLFKTSWRNRLVDLITHAPQYNLMEGLDAAVLVHTTPDALLDLLGLIERLPVSLRLALAELCRPKGRWHVSRRTIGQLQSLLTQAV